MTTEITRLILGLREAGWSAKKINDFLIYIESGNDAYKPARTTTSNNAPPSPVGGGLF